MSSSTKESKGSKLSRLLKVPIRFLIRARDLYIQSMNQCSVVAGYGTAMGCPTGQVGSSLPRSFSVGSSRKVDEDYRALLRVNSLNTMTNKIESDLARRQWRTAGPKTVPRSCSVGVGRIDEDKPCEFGSHVDEVVVKNKHVFPRSRSYAYNSRRAGMV